MKELKIQEATNFLTSNTKEEFPYFYLPEFAQFTAAYEERKIILLTDSFGNTMACRVWKTKFLQVLQALYPPLNASGQKLSREEESDFVLATIQWANANRISRIVQPENFAVFQKVPEETVSAPFGSYILRLENRSEDELFAAIHSKHRNVIRNAEKNNVTVSFGKNTLPDFYYLFKDTMTRSGMFLQDQSYFELMFNMIEDNILCGVAYHDAQPLGALFIPYTRYGAFYLYGASSAAKRVNGAMSLLQWKAIQILLKKGVGQYDFVGARLSNVDGTRLAGIQQFKERFGATLYKGYLWKADIQKMKCKIFDVALALKLKLHGQTPLYDIIDQEKNAAP